MDLCIKFSVTLLKFFPHWENQCQRKKKYYPNIILNPISTEEVVVITDINKCSKDWPAGPSVMKSWNGWRGDRKMAALGAVLGEPAPQENNPMVGVPRRESCSFLSRWKSGLLRAIPHRNRGRQWPTVSWTCRVPSCPRALLCWWGPVPTRLPHFPAKPTGTPPDIYLPLKNEKKWVLMSNVSSALIYGLTWCPGPIWSSYKFHTWGDPTQQGTSQLGAAISYALQCLIKWRSMLLSSFDPYKMTQALKYSWKEAVNERQHISSTREECGRPDPSLVPTETPHQPRCGM